MAEYPWSWPPPAGTSGSGAPRWLWPRQPLITRPSPLLVLRWAQAGLHPCTAVPVRSDRSWRCCIASDVGRHLPALSPPQWGPQLPQKPCHRTWHFHSSADVAAHLGWSWARSLCRLAVDTVDGSRLEPGSDGPGLVGVSSAEPSAEPPGREQLEPALQPGPGQHGHCGAPANPRARMALLQEVMTEVTV